MEFITENYQDIMVVVGAVVTIASVIANKTKTDVDNKAIGWFSKAINLFALNFDKLKK